MPTRIQAKDLKHAVDSLPGKYTTSNNPSLSATLLQSSLSPLLIISDSQHLYLLQFITTESLKSVIERFLKKIKQTLKVGTTPISVSISDEVTNYVRGSLQTFRTPIKLIGTPFQQQVWQALLNIPYGQTWAYQDLAKAIDKPTAYRAVAQANGANNLSIVVPCHRVINKDGKMGGYSGGLTNKKNLLTLEGGRSEQIDLSEPSYRKCTGIVTLGFK